jgi:hypothetical protein
VADQSDVCNALVALISATIYPNGTDKPSPGTFDARVFAGWPVPAALDQDLAKVPAVSQISVFPRPEEHNTTRYETRWREVSRNTATLALTIGGQAVTISGQAPNATNPQNVMVMVNGKPYVYHVQLNDTLLSVLNALTALIAVDYPLVSTQALTMTLPAGARISAARVGVIGVIEREVRRQNKLFQITVWASTPEARDGIAKVIDPALAGTFWIQLADQTQGRLIFKSSTQSDEQQRQRLYRRDLFYYVEFATNQQQTATEITQAELIVQASVNGIQPAQTVADVFA